MGFYCTEVYYEKSAKLSKTYKLDLVVESNWLVQINWPNGGWLGNSHFDPPKVRGGSVKFVSD